MRVGTCAWLSSRHRSQMAGWETGANSGISIADVHLPVPRTVGTSIPAFLCVDRV